MDVRDVFRWPGGSQLFLEVTIDRRGRPAEVGELLTVLQKLQWTAAIAEAMASYCVRARDQRLDSHDKFQLWLDSLPDVPAFDDGSASAFFDATAILKNLIELAGPASAPKRSNIEFKLLIELVELFHENPTRGRFVIGGCLIFTRIFRGNTRGDPVLSSEP